MLIFLMLFSPAMASGQATGKRQHEPIPAPVPYCITVFGVTVCI